MKTPAGATDAPLPFALTAWSVPVLIGAQLFLVGLATFGDAGAWQAHKAIGGGLAIPLLALLAWSCGTRLRRFRGLALLLFGLYCLQFVWLIGGRELGSGAIQALHAANALLLTAVSLLLALRSRAGAPPLLPPDAA